MYIDNINPTILKLSFFDLSYYRLFLVLSVIIGYFILRKLAKEKNLDKNLIDDLLLYLIPSIIIFARLFHVVFYSLDYYLNDPIKIFYIWQGGVSSHGAIIGGILAVLLFCKIKKIKFYTIADLLVIPIALIAFFIRMGNFFNQEVIGRVTDLSWAVKFKNYEGFRHPVQIYEAITNLLIFSVLIKIRKLKLPQGFLFWFFIVIYSLSRFLLEFFKEYQVFTSGLTMGQLLTLPFLIIGIIMLFYIVSNNR